MARRLTRSAITYRARDDVQLFERDGRVYVLDLITLAESVIDGIDAATLGRVTKFLATSRTLSEIVQHLSDFDADDIPPFVASLVGVVLEESPRHGVAVQVRGSTALARRLRARYETKRARATRVRLTVLSRGTWGAVRSGALPKGPSLFVMEHGSFALVGPLTLRGCSPCADCALESFKNGLTQASVSVSDVRFSELGNVDLIGAVSAFVGKQLSSLSDRIHAPSTLGAVFRISKDRIEEFTVDMRAGCATCAPLREGKAPPRLKVSRKTYASGRTRIASDESAIAIATRAVAATTPSIVVEDCNGRWPDRFRGLSFLETFETARVGDFDATRPLVAYATQQENGFGISLDRGSARAASIYEWFERNASSLAAATTLRRAARRELREPTIDVDAIAETRLPGVYAGARAATYSDDHVLEWIWGHALPDGKPVLVPVPLALSVGGNQGTDRVLWPNTGTSGMAASACIDDAIVNGLYEVAQHASWYRAQRTFRPVRQLDVTAINDPTERRITAALEHIGYDVKLYDLTDELGVPVVFYAARQAADLNYGFLWGCAAHFDWRVAVRKAALECAQVAFVSGVYARRMSFDNGTSVYRHWHTARWLAAASSTMIKPVQEPVPRSPYEAVARLCAAFRRVKPGVVPVAVEVAHPAIRPMSIAKVIVPGIVDEVADMTQLDPSLDPWSVYPGAFD